VPDVREQGDLMEPRTCDLCGHTEDYHEHYRTGTDCGVKDCLCPGFVVQGTHPVRDWLRRLFR
jgi:hypothetical protein